MLNHRQLIPNEVREAASGKVARLAVGISDGISKLAAHVHKADVDQFAQSLNRLPLLLPTGDSVLRPTLDRWFEAQGLRPHIVGEFEDCALLAAFAARGLRVFPVSRPGASDVGLMRGLRLPGRCDDVKEQFHAIRSRRGQHHPLVLQVIAAARC